MGLDCIDGPRGVEFMAQKQSVFIGFVSREIEVVVKNKINRILN